MVHQGVDLTGQPGWQPRRRFCDFLQLSCGQLAPQFFQRCFRSRRTEPRQGADDIADSLPREDQLPRWRVVQFDLLGAELEFSAAPGSKEDLAYWHLGRQAQPVGGCRAVADRGFAALSGSLLNDLVDFRRMHSEATLDRKDVHAATGAQQLAAARQPRQGLIDRRPAAKVRQGPGDQGADFWLGGCVLQDLVGEV